MWIQTRRKKGHSRFLSKALTRERKLKMLMLFIFKEQLVTVAVGANLVVCEHYVTVVPGSEKAAILSECTESVS